MGTIESTTPGVDWTATTLSGEVADVLTLVGVIVVAYLVVMIGVALVFSWSWLRSRRTCGPARHRRRDTIGRAGAAGGLS